MDGGSMASITDGDHTFAWRFEQEPQPILAAVRTGLQMQKERLIQMARAIPKFVGRTLESLEAADLSVELENAQERRAALPRLNAENTYEGVLPGVSVRYSVSGETLKEDIILASAEALSRAAIRLPKDYDYEVTEQSELRVKDRETGETRFVMRRPNVYDSSGEEVFASVVLTDMGEYIRMEYVVDAAFMESAAYPVTIDPIVQTSTTNVSVCDAYIWKKNPNTNYGSVSLMRCGTGSGGESISLIKFNKLIRLKASDTVLSATLRVSALNYPSDPEIMGCYPIKSAWTETGVTWNKMTPANDTHISRTMSAYIPATKPTYCYFDITSEYRGWYLKDANGNSRNFGVALRRPPEVTTGGNYVEWTGCKHNSSKGPCVIVNYVSHAGRKGWWQYESMSAGRAGSAYVDLFNGNLVFEHADGATTGNRMPVAISHVYNSCLSESNPVSCGNGWRTSMHQSVCKKAIGSTNYYVWTDGDATEHFFAISGSQPYADAEGMSLKLTTTSTELTITDKGDTKLVFPLPADANQKFLLRMADACGNSASLSYDASGRLTGVTDGVGRVTTLTYNAAGLLSQIAVPGRPAVTYSYTGTQLTGVGYGDITGRTTYTYEETSNMLVSAVNYDGVRVDLTYEGLNAYDSAAIDNYAAQVRRVVAMETRSDSIRGAKQRFDYEHMTTKVTSVTNAASEEGKTITYQFNNAGNVVCCFDELGYAQSNTFSASVANQQTSASQMKRVVINLLPNLDFASGWTTTKGATGDAAARDTSVRCLSMPSLKLTKTSAAETRHCQTATVPAAGLYTFSAYVKNAAALASGKEAMLHSLSEQISYYSDHIQSHPGWEYAGVYADTDYTGTKDSRPEFQRLLADCREGKIDRVLTKSLSRFARNTVTLLEIVREMKALGVAIVFEKENIDTSSGDGELMLSILASFAQAESLSVSENCKWRIRKDFAEGKTMNLALLYGYRSVDGKIEIVPEEAEVVRRVFAAYLSGKGTPTIAAMLRREHAPTRMGGDWYDKGVMEMLKNEKYTGDALLQKTYKLDHLSKKVVQNRGELPQYYVEGSHPAIIDREIFERVQALIARNYLKTAPSKPLNTRYPFTGKILCEYCGKHFKRKAAYRRGAWQCQTYLTYGRARCPAKQIPEDTLTALTMEVLNAEELNDAQMARLKEIRVTGPNDLNFVFWDGCEEKCTWKDRSRAENWTDEMKKAASRKMKAYHAERRNHHD